MAHVDSRDSVSFKPRPVQIAGQPIPARGVYVRRAPYLFEWVDKGKVPPRAERILLDRNVANDGSPMALDEHGNAKRRYSEPVCRRADNEAWRSQRGREPAHSQSRRVDRGPRAGRRCPNVRPGRISDSTGARRAENLRQKSTYQDRVKRRLDELEKAGWSLAAYRDTILGDAAKVEF